MWWSGSTPIRIVTPANKASSQLAALSGALQWWLFTELRLSESNMKTLAKLVRVMHNSHLLFEDLDLFPVKSHDEAERICVEDGRHVEWDLATTRADNATHFLREAGCNDAAIELLEDQFNDKVLVRVRIVVRTLTWLNTPHIQANSGHCVTRTPACTTATSTCGGRRYRI